ncbi:GNAT family N-acetyltransferase [Candidatus Roizmanbacteria bacterium]|nr:GNAT family N-acetyltransferase [Candidatus Roizmanbacteria bacterium]
MENTPIKIEQLLESSENDTQSIRSLAAKLGSSFRPLTNEDMQEMLKSPNIFILVARSTENKKIVGMITVCAYRIPYVKKAYLDDFVVDEEYRGQGIGSQLFKSAIEFAKEKKAAYVDFTSNPKRIEGNKLYEKLGFKKRETNVYRLDFDYGEA